MDVQLTPPIGTCYYKSYTVPLSGDSKKGIFTLNVTFHVYVTNVQPTDEDFTTKGGKVYIIVVYDGSVIGGPQDTLTIGSRLTNVTGDSGLFLSTQQLPTRGSGRKEGGYTHYTIDFSQTMSMYNNSGNGAFNFSARYRKDFSLYKFTQDPFAYPPHFWECILAPSQQGVEANPVNHVQVFEANKLAVAKLRLLFIFIVVSQGPAGIEVPSNPETVGSAELTYDLDFSAETMACAEVG
ncbi:hypothetical protein APHAL10511_008610 [Amanita phalloides]|nr:hypothetical protein APHAL10511_008610 [Amanita phalloides]